MFTSRGSDVTRLLSRDDAKRFRQPFDRCNNPMKLVLFFAAGSTRITRASFKT